MCGAVWAYDQRCVTVDLSPTSGKPATGRSSEPSDQPVMEWLSGGVGSDKRRREERHDVKFVFVLFHLPQIEGGLMP